MDGPLHWTERARRGFPPRVAAQLCLLMLPVVAGGVAVIFSGPMASTSRTATIWVAAAVAAAVAMRSRVVVERRVRGRPYSARTYLRDLAAVSSVLFPHLILVLVMLAAIDAVLRVWTLPLLAALFVLFTLGASGCGVFLARALGLAQRADEHLRGLVAGCAERAGVRVRGVYVLRWSYANAYALPLMGWIVFSEEALRRLDDEHIAAVAAHELGHLGERRLVVAARVAVLLLFFPVGAARLIIGQWGLIAFAPMYLALILGLVLIRRLARRMEQRADHHAHEQDAGGFARALERIYRANLVPAVVPSKRAVHPHLYDRLESAGVEPDYPRPAPPSRARGLLATLAAVLVMSALLGGVRIGIAVLAGSDRASESAILRWAALTGGSADALHDVAVARAERGDLDAAVVFARAAAWQSDRSHHWARLSQLLSQAGRCVAADAALLEAYRALRSDRAFLDAAARQLALCSGDSRAD